MEVNAEALERFKEVCAVDEAKAVQYLTHCDGQLETAVQLFFQTGGTLDNTHEAQNNVNNAALENALRRRRNSSHNRARDASAVSRRRPRQPIGWIDWLLAAASIPIRLTITTLWDIFAFITEMVFGQQRQSVTDPRGDVAQFIDDYRRNYITDVAHPIDFLNLPYAEALQQAKQNLQIVLVYLHNPNHKDTVNFVKNVLHSEQLAQLLASQNMVVWGVSLSSAQGRALSVSLRPQGYPYICLLSLASGKMQTILRLHSVLEPAAVVLNLRLAIEDHQAQLNVARMQKAQLDESRRIRNEQEREYRESAAKDRAKLQERRRLESEKADAEEREREKQRQAEARKELIQSKKETVRAAPPAETTEKDVVRVQVRFPSGGKFDRKFLPDDSLELLFDTILCYDQCPDFFTVHTTYPRKELLCSPQWYHELRSAQQQYLGEEQVNSYQSAKSFRDEGLLQPFVVMVHDCEA